MVVVGIRRYYEKSIEKIQIITNINDYISISCNISKYLQNYQNNDIGTLENYILDEDGNKTNISLRLTEEHVFGDITGLNMTITSSSEEPRKATFTLKLLNNTDKDIDNQDIKIVFYDKNHNDQTVQYSRIDHIGAHEDGEVKNDMFTRIIDAYDYSVTYIEVNGVG